MQKLQNWNSAFFSPIMFNAQSCTCHFPAGNDPSDSFGKRLSAGKWDGEQSNFLPPSSCTIVLICDWGLL